MNFSYARNAIFSAGFIPASTIGLRKLCNKILCIPSWSGSEVNVENSVWMRCVCHRTITSLGLGVCWGLYFTHCLSHRRVWESLSLNVVSWSIAAHINSAAYVIHCTWNKPSGIGSLTVQGLGLCIENAWAFKIHEWAAFWGTLCEIIMIIHHY